MFNVLSALCFILFVCTGLIVVWTQRATQALRYRQIAVNTFILYCLGASFGAGLTQRNAWPFAHWALISGLVPEMVLTPRLMAVDSRGTEYAIDHRAVQPLPFDELTGWLRLNFPQLDRTQQDRVGHYLLGLMEQARVRALADKGVGYIGRYLGPLAAPYFHVRPALWSRPGALPSLPLVSVRLYEETWDWRHHLRYPNPYKRVLIYEYPQP